MIVLDTNVISELRKSNAAPAVARWAERYAVNQFYLSAISLLEIERGALQIARRDKRQGQMLRTWIDEQVLPKFDGRVLAVDSVVALRCAALHVPDPRSERDALIAATALVHGMTVATRDVDDFTPMGVPVINPWETQTPARKR